MKLQTKQLEMHLKKNLVPIYLVSGDDFLLVQEACATISKHAFDSGFTGKEVFYVEPGFNWEIFLGQINNSSLFGDQALIELHLKGKLSESGSKILQNYAKQPSQDKIILIITNKLEAAQQKTSWFKAVDGCGVILQVWPIEENQLPAWISSRLKAANLTTNSDGLQLIVNHVAGNLLAAVQEIEKLRLLYGEGNLTIDQISQAITDNSRFNIFNLLDAAINKNSPAISKILANLKSEGIDPTLILWAIANELRSLINISFAIKQGIKIEEAMEQNRVWRNRQTQVKKMLMRYDMPKLQNLLKSALNIDLIIKGADNQRLVWHELENIYLKFAGKK